MHDRPLTSREWGEFVDVLSQAEECLDTAESAVNDAFHTIEGGLTDLEDDLKEKLRDLLDETDA
jgi:hypothetical protein